MHKRDRKMLMQNRFISKEEMYILACSTDAGQLTFMLFLLFLLKSCTHITYAASLFRKPDVCVGKKFYKFKAKS